MLTLFQALVLGLLQGVTELFPISSLGHTVIFPTLFGWTVNQRDPAFLTFVVVTHLATALALLAFYWQEWVKIVWGMLQSVFRWKLEPGDVYARLGWLLVVSTIPVGLLGVLLEKRLSALFAVPLFAGIFLLGNAVLLYGAEQLIRRRPSFETHSHERMAQLSWGQAVKIGLMQCLALLPGFSRTGASLSGGLLVNLSHEDAAHYAFLLATPILFAAAALKIPQMALSGERVSALPFLVGAVAAAAAAYLSVRYLSRYFKTHTLKPFAYYCAVIGVVAIVAVVA